MWQFWMNTRTGRLALPAIDSGNLEGWKVNEVTEFTGSQGENPEEDYTDNVIFPSGTDEPLTISEWE